MNYLKIPPFPQEGQGIPCMGAVLELCCLDRGRAEEIFARGLPCVCPGQRWRSAELGRGGGRGGKVRFLLRQDNGETSRQVQLCRRR